jgi:hypothetical protein
MKLSEIRAAEQRNVDRDLLSVSRTMVNHITDNGNREPDNGNYYYSALLLYTEKGIEAFEKYLYSSIFRH